MNIYILDIYNRSDILYLVFYNFVETCCSLNSFVKIRFFNTVHF